MALDNHEDSNAEMYRRQILELAEKITMLEQTVQELQGQVQHGYKRIMELVEERNKAESALQEYASRCFDD